MGHACYIALTLTHTYMVRVNEAQVTGRIMPREGEKYKLKPEFPQGRLRDGKPRITFIPLPNLPQTTPAEFNP